MSVAIIGTVGVPACYGGFETLVDNFLDEDGDFLVYCSSKSYDQKLPEYKGAKLKYLPFNANGISSIIYDAISMLHAIFNGRKVLLILGVSACLLLPFIRLFTKRKLVVNIDGLEWRRDKWNPIAKLYLKLSERTAVKFAHTIIADNKGIADYVLDEYGVIAEVIAYGGDHVLTAPLSSKSGDYAFALCRIEPENNVHTILEAFASSGFLLKFVGNWDASEYGRQLKQKYYSAPSIEIIGPTYDLDQLFKYRSECAFYVHGHSAGGTNPSLVEAMFFSKQILAFDCVYNRETLNNEGLYFTDIDTLKNHLSHINFDSWRSDGDRIAQVATYQYTWKAIRNAYLSLI